MAEASKKLIEAYVHLLSILECPVCLKYGSSNQAPIKICTEGHFICGDCARNLNLCPTCRGNFTAVRPTILDQIIDALLYPCSNIGCGKMFPIKEIHQHEQQCSFQEEKNIKYNKNIIQSQNILKHIEDNYSSFCLNQGDDITELGLCFNCLSVGLSDDREEIQIGNKQKTNTEQSKTEVPGSSTKNNVPQAS